MNYEEKIVTYFEQTAHLIDEIKQQCEGIERTFNLIHLQDLMNNEIVEWGEKNPISDHPYICLCKFFKNEAERRLRKNQNRSNEKYINNVREEIINTLYNNRLKADFFKDGEDYIIGFNRESNTFSLELFDEYGSLTEIQDLRLIEKIESLAMDTGKISPHIAVLGKLKKTEEFTSYLDTKGITPLIDEFLYKSKDMFYCSDKETGIELKNIASLTSLLQDYDMVFFLDESYFYKKNQSPQSRDVKLSAINVDIYWKWFLGSHKRLNMETVHYLFSIYNEALHFLKCAFSSSMEREWDSQLLDYLEALAQKCEDSAEVYIYIENSKIGEENIEHQAVCKEEYYDGKSLYVYKVSSDKKIVNEKNQGKPMDSKEEYINGSSVDIWKFIKSISNNFYKRAFGQPDLQAWKDARIEFVGGLQDADKNDFCVYYRFTSNVSEEMKIYLKELMESISDTNELLCIRMYLKKLFYSAVLSRADSVRGLMLAFKIQNCKNITFEEKEETNVQRVGRIHLKNYRDRKAYYSIIERLSYARIHDFDQVERILKYDFKTRFAEFMSDEEFSEFMVEINEECKRLGDLASRLYLYSEAFTVEIKDGNEE